MLEKLNNIGDHLKNNKSRKGLLLASVVTLSTVASMVVPSDEVQSVFGKAFMNGREYHNGTLNIDQVEESQLAVLENVLNSVINEPYNSNNLRLNEPSRRKELINNRRAILIDGVSWNLSWKNGHDILFWKASVINLEASVLSTGRTQSDKYLISVRGLDLLINEEFKPAILSSRSLRKASNKFFKLPAGLNWSTDQSDDGVVMAKAEGLDSSGNKYSYTINSSGVAELIVTN